MRRQVEFTKQILNVLVSTEYVFTVARNKSRITFIHVLYYYSFIGTAQETAVSLRLAKINDDFAPKKMCV